MVRPETIIKTAKDIYGIKNKKNILPVSVAAVLILVFVGSKFYITFSDAASDMIFIFTHLNYSYQEKMTIKWGLLYRYISLIGDNTNSGNSILLPVDIAPHSVDGRIEYFRYFLTDRTLINYGSEMDNDNYEYIVLAKGYLHPIYDGPSQVNYIWPDFPVKSDKIVYLIQQDNGTYVQNVFYGNYNPDDFRGKNVWGIIEIKK